MNTHDVLQLMAVLRAAKTIEELAYDLEAEEFMRDRSVVSAVVWQLVLIGNSVERLSPSFKAEVPDLRWNDFVRIKDGFMRGGENFNKAEVWIYIQETIPDIITIFTALIQAACDLGFAAKTPAGAAR